MDTNILVALAPIIVAAGGGLAFLAYTHPREYQTLTRVLLGIYVVLCICGMVWYVSNSQTYIAVMKAGVVPLDKSIQLDAARDAVSLPWWWFPAMFVGIAYAMFLASFPAWIPDVAKQLQQPHSDENKKE